MSKPLSSKSHVDNSKACIFPEKVFWSIISQLDLRTILSAALFVSKRINGMCIRLIEDTCFTPNFPHARMNVTKLPGGIKVPDQVSLHVLTLNSGPRFKRSDIYAINITIPDDALPCLRNFQKFYSSLRTKKFTSLKFIRLINMQLNFLLASNACRMESLCMKYSTLPDRGRAFSTFSSLKRLHLTLGGTTGIQLKFLPPNIECLSVHLPDKSEELYSRMIVDAEACLTLTHIDLNILSRSRPVTLILSSQACLTVLRLNMNLKKAAISKTNPCSLMNLKEIHLPGSESTLMISEIGSTASFTRFLNPVLYPNIKFFNDASKGESLQSS